jgi:hypothetical protein
MVDLFDDFCVHLLVLFQRSDDLLKLVSAQVTISLCAELINLGLLMSILQGFKFCFRLLQFLVF